MNRRHGRRAHHAFLILCLALVGFLLSACSDDDGATDPQPRPEPPELSTQGLVAERAALDALEQINTLVANVPAWTQGILGSGKDLVWSPNAAEYVDGWWRWSDQVSFATGQLTVAIGVQLLADGVPQRDVEGADRLVAEASWILDLDELAGEDRIVFHSETGLDFAVDGLPDGPFTMGGSGTVEGETTVEVDGVGTTYDHDGSWQLSLALENLDSCPTGSFEAAVSSESGGVAEGPFELEASYEGGLELSWTLSLADEVVDSGSTELLSCVADE